MSERTLKKLVGAFAIVLVLWLGTMLVGRGSGSIEASGEVSRLFQGVSPESIEAATFASRTGVVALERDGEAWRVNGHRADPSVVERFTLSLIDVRIGDLAASNPANHDRMGVSADSAVVVTLTAGGAERSFLLGKTGRRFGTAYLRLPDSDDVYLLDADLHTHATRGVEAWRDRRMAAIDTASIGEIEVTGAARGYTLVRADSAWTLDGGGEADPVAVQGILSELSNLMATGFLADGDSLAVLPEASVTVARSPAGEDLVAVRLGEGEGDRWGRTSSDDVLYRVSSFRADRVAPTREAVAPGS